MLVAFTVAASFRRSNNRTPYCKHNTFDAADAAQQLRVNGENDRPFCHGRQTGKRKSASEASYHEELRRRNNDVEIASSDERSRVFVACRYRDAS